MEDTLLCPECSQPVRTTEHDWERPEQKPILMVCTMCSTQYYVWFFTEGKVKGLAFLATDYEEMRREYESPETLLQELKDSSMEE